MCNNSHLLQGQRSLDDILADVVVLGQVEELPDLGSSLRTQPEILIIYNI
jgi:hypothetical protein